MQPTPVPSARRYRLALLAAAITVWLVALGGFASGQSNKATPQRGKSKPADTAAPHLMPGLYAHVETTEGAFTFRLFEQERPKTVANFVGLAEGTLDPATGKPGQSVPFYNGLTFHRVIPGFMIQGGDPLGNSTGGPGYRIADEFLPPLHYDRPGLVGMASTVPNGNGSQFFVTLVPAPHLDGKHTLFGEVVAGMDIVRRINAGPTDINDRPLNPVTIRRITIERIAE